MGKKDINKKDEKLINKDIPDVEVKPEELDEKEFNAEDKEENTIESELQELKVQLEEKTKQSEDYLGMLQRSAAEFDNYRKRTVKEKETLYQDAVCDVITSFLPVLDNMERALEACSSEGDAGSLKNGVEMIFKQFKEAMKNHGVEEINTEDAKFDPELHNAVMHVEDESYGENQIIEVFQKGYKQNDRVLRHSMVKVAN